MRKDSPPRTPPCPAKAGSATEGAEKKTSLPCEGEVGRGQKSKESGVSSQETEGVVLRERVETKFEARITKYETRNTKHAPRIKNFLQPFATSGV